MARRGIYKQKGSKNWWIRYAGLDGRIIYESSRSEKITDAIDLLTKRKGAVKEGKYPEVKTIGKHTFANIAEEYLKWIQGRQRSAKNRVYVVKQLMDRFGLLPLRSFNTALVEQFQTELMNRNLKNSSCNGTVGLLKRMFTKAVEWEMVEEEVLKRVRKVKLLRDTGKRLRYLSKEECRALLDACDAHLLPIVIAALHTGMRRGEILSLIWDNVDLRHGFILLSDTKNGERRELPINQTLRTTLQNLTRRLDVPYVFFDSANGQPYKEVKHSFHSALKRATVEKCTRCEYQKAITKAEPSTGTMICPFCTSETKVQKGIPDFHFHDLRHTFASQLVMAGVDLTTVSRLLGHKSLSMTLRYSHLAPDHMSNAIGALDRVFEKRSSSVGERFA